MARFLVVTTLWEVPSGRRRYGRNGAAVGDPVLDDHWRPCRGALEKTCAGNLAFQWPVTYGATWTRALLGQQIGAPLTKSHGDQLPHRRFTHW
jgi:hypothetical protein